MKYRAEIDGLRALAVVPVILFHAGFDHFSGGFVGVDVFFVISGYLITTILIEEIEQQRFSIANFYERRARRILPALFFIMLVCIPFAWLWMLPKQMEDFSQSLMAVSLFVSNILFWSESEYFAAASEEKPLLHTWSLAVEEQYYLLFPVFLFLAWRFGKQKVFWMIVVLAIISLLFSEWGWRNAATANFYLAPSRVWELFAGSIAAFIVQQRGVQKNNGLALLGLIAILYAIFAYDEATPFPSVYALVPVLGVVCLILFAERGTIAARILSLKPFVAIGLISYSAYLWHQPIFAFTRIRLQEHSSPMLMLSLSIASILLAYLSWKYIEKPFRRRERFTSKHIFSLSLAGIVGFLIIGGIGDVQKGFDWRLSDAQRELLAWEAYPRKKPYREGVCFLRADQSYADFDAQCTANPSDTLIWGDSHAAALASGWRKLAAIHQLATAGCPPIVDTPFPRHAACVDINQRIIDLIRDKAYRTVILHADWQPYSSSVIERLATTVKRLQELGVQQIVIVGGVPQYSPSLPSRLFFERKALADITVIKSRQRDVAANDEILRSVAVEYGVSFVSALTAFCEQEMCLAVIHQKDSLSVTAWDYGHLTVEGAVFLATQLITELEHERHSVKEIQ